MLQLIMIFTMTFIPWSQKINESFINEKIVFINVTLKSKHAKKSLDMYLIFLHQKHFLWLFIWWQGIVTNVVWATYTCRLDNGLNLLLEIMGKAETFHALQYKPLTHYLTDLANYKVNVLMPYNNSN